MEKELRRYKAFAYLAENMIECLKVVEKLEKEFEVVVPYDEVPI